MGDDLNQCYSTAIWIQDENIEFKYYFMLKCSSGKVYKIPLYNGTVIKWNGLKTKHATIRVGKPGRKFKGTYGGIYSLFMAPSKTKCNLKRKRKALKV